MKTKFDTAMILVTMVILSAAGCGRTQFEKPTIKTNAPPPAPLSEYDRIDLQSMTYAPSVLSQEEEKVVRRVAGKMDELLSQQLDGIIMTWNTEGGDTPARGTGTLIIQPVITQLKYVTKGQRIWAKSMYGNSGIVVELKMVDDAGATIHKALFYGQAGAAYGQKMKGWGEQETIMLKSVSDRIARYVVKNYEAPYGGGVSY